MEIIRSVNLSKRHRGLTALDNVSLSIDAGKPIALVGPNGAGKTTLISLISGFIHPSNGKVTVCGASPGHASVKSKLSVLPQDALFDPNFTIGSQLKLYARLRGISNPTEEVNRVLQRVQLADQLGNKSPNLSHGMKKRLLIAQALLGQPELILLDEPTAGIDPPNAKLIRDLISAESSNTTFVVSSHNLDELEKICEKVIHLVDGKLISYDAISDEATETGYLTLVADPDARQLIETTEGVIRVNQSQANEFTVQFDAVNHPQFHISLLQHLADNNLSYKRLINGRTLEEKMYRSENVKE